MSLDNIYRKGINRVWDEDAESQKQYLSAVAECRGMKMLDFRRMNAMFIPNDEYLLRYFDSEIASQSYGFYDYDGKCVWNNCLIMPIYNVADKVASVAGFNPFRYTEAHEKQDWSETYYSYASSKVFKRGSYLFYEEGEYKRALEDGYVFLTDGVFDAISVHEAGFNAMAMMGSNVTPEIASMLLFVKRVLVLCDNDDAGYKLVNDLKRVHKRIVTVKQNVAKDIDEMLKGTQREVAIEGMKKAVAGIQSVYELGIRG